jgi:hypothetical protein
MFSPFSTGRLVRLSENVVQDLQHPAISIKRRGLFSTGNKQPATRPKDNRSAGDAVPDIHAGSFIPGKARSECSRSRPAIAHWNEHCVEESL